MRHASDANSDTSIRRYRAKRDFSRTPEPSLGASKVGSALRFVVQKHHARKLHWDFRLEHDGVLWSWAVPKGPSLDPADKRLAVHVEDHPIDYAGFHGSIPDGNYGAGTVEIWDEGTWTPHGEPATDMQAGEIKFALSGARLRGSFVLVRMRQRRRDPRPFARLGTRALIGATPTWPPCCPDGRKSDCHSRTTDAHVVRKSEPFLLQRPRPTG